jgi:acyl carrier protein
MTADRVRKVINDNFTIAAEWAELPADVSLVENYILDSLDMLTLVSLIENEFGVRVNDEDVVLDNFGSIAQIAAYVDRRAAA